MSDVNCSTCEYYQPRSKKSGQCRGSTPTPEIGKAGMWPNVAAEEICGHHPEWDRYIRKSKEAATDAP